MSQVKIRSSRHLIVAISTLALGMGTLCTLSVRGDDMKTADEPMMTMTPDQQKMVNGQLAKMKEMAADPKQAEQVTKGLARMMVMEHMARSMAMDPDFQKQVMDVMSDPGMKKLHGDAKMMAADPEQMKQIQSEIAGDPKEMKLVLHHAMMMTMKVDKKSPMQDKMGGMEDKANDMGSKLMDKMQK